MKINSLPLRLAGLIFFWLLSVPGVRAQVNQSLYTDSLLNGWQDYSWATVNFSSPTVVHSGSYSVSVNAAAYQGFFLHHTAFDASLYTNLTFWINGGTGGQLVQVQALLNGVAQTSVSLAKLPTNSWQQITLPLVSLSISNQPNLDGFWIQDRSGTTQPVFYVDDIQLTARPAPAIVPVNINATQTIRPVDARMFAVNTAIWDDNLDTTNTANAMSEAGMQMFRYPGGSASDDYHWASNTSGTNTWTWATGFSRFAHLATNLNAQVFITVNYGAGTPAEAAAWVRSANVTNHYAFKYWEIGNENYGDWENDTNAAPHDPFTYATRAKDYFNQMKAADPTIKVGVVVVTGEDAYANYNNHPATNPRTSQTHNGWTPVLLATLKSLGVTPDFLIYHRYAQNPGSEDDASLLQSSATWTNDAADLRQQLTDYLGAPGTNVELLCTENNSVSSNPGKQSTSLVNALFLADSVGEILQTEFNSLVWWDLRNGQNSGYNNSASLYGWRAYGDYGLMVSATNRYPTFYAAKLLKYFVRAGDSVVRASSDYPLLAAYAARRTNGSLALLIINKSSVAALNASLTLAGFAPHSSAVAYAYGVPQDNAAQTGIGSQDLAQTNFTVAGTNFLMSFPAYSATVIQLPPAAPRLSMPPGTFPTNGQFRLQLAGQSGAQYVFQASADLQSWLPVATNTLAGSSLNWTDALAPNFLRRFYRAVWLP